MGLSPPRAAAPLEATTPIAPPAWTASAAASACTSPRPTPLHRQSIRLLARQPISSREVGHAALSSPMYAYDRNKAIHTTD